MNFSGEIAALGAAICWSCSTILYRNVSNKITPNNINLFKCVFTTIVYAFIILIFGLNFHVPGEFLVPLLLSGVVGIAISDNGFFAALKFLGPQLTTSIQCLAPPFVTLLSWIFLKEILTPVQLVGMTITTCAVLGTVLRATNFKKISRTDHRQIILGIIFAVGSAATHAIGVVMVRNIGNQVDTTVNSILRILAAFPFILLFSLKTKEIREFHPEKLERKTFIALFLAALIGTALGMFLMTYSIQNSVAGVAAALCATYPIWTALLSGIILREKLDKMNFLFTIIAFLGIVFILGFF